MTHTTALSPARETAFQATQTAQGKKHGGHVQFSLPPVSDPTAPSGTSAAAAGSSPATGAAALSRNLLPIAVPIAALNDLTPGHPPQPVTSTPPSTGTGNPAPQTPITRTAGNQGNMVSARLISRLYQQPG